MMSRRPTTELEDGDPSDDDRLRGGILSQLMRGFVAAPRSSHRPNKSKMNRADSTASVATSVSRTSTLEGNGGMGAGGVPTMTKLGFRARTDCGGGEWFSEALDPDDPKVTGVVSKKLFEGSLGHGGGGGKDKHARRASIQYHVAGELSSFLLPLLDDNETTWIRLTLLLSLRSC
jgi:hypothetical protein